VNDDKLHPSAGLKFYFCPSFFFHILIFSSSFQPETLSTQQHHRSTTDNFATNEVIDKLYGRTMAPPAKSARFTG